MRRKIPDDLDIEAGGFDPEVMEALIKLNKLIKSLSGLRDMEKEGQFVDPLEGPTHEPDG